MRSEDSDPVRVGAPLGGQKLQEHQELQVWEAATERRGRGGGRVQVAR